MSLTAIILLHVAYIVVWLVATTVVLAISEPHKSSVTEIEDFGWAYVAGLFWPVFLAGCIIYGIAYLPGKGVDKLFQSTTYVVKEIKNPKENV